MATNIPLGFHIWAVTLTVTGSTHNNVFTYAGKNNGFLTAPSINNVWNTAAVAAGGILNPSGIPAGWTCVERKLTANIGGVLQQDINANPIVGAGVATPPPMNTAIIVRKDTGFVGRPYQARLFYPPNIAEANVDAAGNITAGLPVLQTSWTNFHAAVKAAGVDPVVLHKPSLGLVPTATSGVTVKSRLGTIGRRMRR